MVRHPSGFTDEGTLQGVGVSYAELAADKLKVSFFGYQ